MPLLLLLQQYGSAAVIGFFYRLNGEEDIPATLNDDSFSQLQQAFWAALNASIVRLEDVVILDVTPVRMRSKRGLLQLNSTTFAVFAVQLRSVAGGTIVFTNAVSNFNFTTNFAQQLVALDFTSGTSIQRSTAGGSALELAAPIQSKFVKFALHAILVCPVG
jgi:hypothetical protein